MSKFSALFLIVMLSARYGLSAPKEDFARLAVGKWASPRHTYIYSADGTWRLAPEEGTTHGLWRIDGNKLTISYPAVAGYENKKFTYTILSLNPTHWVYKDDKIVFRMKRITK